MELTLHKAQSEALYHLFGPGSDEEARAVVLTMSRGAGKSLLASIAAAKAIEVLLAMPDNILNKRVIIIAPTWTQTLSIYLPYLVGVLHLDQYANKYSAHAGKFWFGPNNDVTLELASAESIQRLRGLGAFLVITDESTSWEIDAKEAFEGVIHPMQTTRHANRWKQLDISTPMGKDYFWELSNNQEKDPRWKTISAPYNTIPHLDQDEINKAKATMDPVKFAREYECSFEGSGNRVFYMFDRKKNINKDILDFQDGETVYCGIDFNVSIQATVFYAIRGRQIHVINELKGAPNTEELAKYIKAMYPDKKLIATPDPTGRASKTSAAVGASDFSILEKAGITCLARTKSPSVVDSVAAVNAMLGNANGDVNLLIHPRCANLILDLERAAWLDAPSKAVMDKRGDNDPHFGDALRYGVEYYFPIRSGTKSVSQGFMF